MNLKTENPNLLSFSGTISICLIPIYYLGGFIFYFFGLTLQVTVPNFTFDQKVILLITFLIWIPIFSIYLFVQSLPFSPIDFNANKIFLSLLHKILFIVTLPIFVISLYIEFFIIRLFFTDQMIVTLAVLIFDLFPLFIWIFVTLFFWELLNGKGSSQFLNVIRSRKTRFYENKSNNKNTTTFSRRWGVITGSVPLITATTGLYLGQYFGLFSILFFSSLGLDLLAVLLLLHYLYQFKPKQEFSAFRNINRKIFGEKDITIDSAATGLGINFLFMILFLSFPSLNQTRDINNLFFILYISNIAIFCITLWSNQIKSILKMTDEKNKNFDEYSDMLKID